MVRTRSVLAAIAIAAVAWFAWQSELGQPPPPPQDEDAAADHAAAPATAPAQAPAATARANGQDGSWWSQSLVDPEAVLVAAAEDDSRAGVLRGRLTVRQQPWIHPAAVEVRLTRSWLDSVVPVETEPGVRAPLRDELRTTTDEHGCFAFRLVPPATELFFLIGHRTEWQDYQKVPKLPRAAEELDLGDVFLDQRGEIVGRALLRGRPVANATVRAIDDPLLDGTSGFEELQAARTAGLESYRSSNVLRGGPIPDWVVRREQFLPFPTTTTDAQGGFRLRGVRPGNHNLFVTLVGQPFGDARGRSDGVLVASGRTTDVGAVTLRSDGTVFHLQFVDESERPWVAARVSLLSSQTGFGQEPSLTDAQGRVLVWQPDPRARLVFALPGGGPWMELEPPDGGELRVWSRDLRTPPERIVVPRPPELVVTLADRGGRLIAGGTVRSYVQAAAFRPVDRALPAAMQPRERAPGVHRGRLPCPIVLVASADGFAPAMAVATAAQVTMTMLPLEAVTVRVHDLQGRAIAGAAVRAQVHGNPELTFAGAQWEALANDRVLVGTTDDRGELQVPVWPTFFSFQASHRDFAPSANPKCLPVPGERIDLLLRGGGDVHGTLTFEHRPAPAGLRVRAQQRPPAGHPLENSGYLDERIAVTGGGGTFAFRQLAAGIWELGPELPGVPTANGPRQLPQPWQKRQIQLDEGQELHTTIEIQQDELAPTQILGTVTQNGATVPDALVRIRELDPPKLRERNGLRRQARAHGNDEILRFLGPDELAPWQRCTTDAFGEFRFRELSPNADHELRVDVAQGGRLQFVGRRVVRAGTALQPARVDFALATSDVRLTCLRQGLPVTNRMVRLRQVIDPSTEGARYELLLDAAGQAWVDQLPIGSWTIEPMHGGRCEPAQFEVLANQPAMPTFAFLDR